MKTGCIEGMFSEYSLHIQVESHRSKHEYPKLAARRSRQAFNAATTDDGEVRAINLERSSIIIERQHEEERLIT